MKKKNEITSPKLKSAIKKLIKAKKRLADTKNKDRQPVQGGTQFKNIQHGITHWLAPDDFGTIPNPNEFYAYPRRLLFHQSNFL